MVTVNNTDFIKRNYILRDIKIKFPNSSTIEKLISCMLVYNNPNSTMDIIIDRLVNFKITNSAVYNRMINHFLDDGIFSIEDNFINYTKDFEAYFFNIYNQYRYSDSIQFSLAKKFNIDGEKIIISKVLLNLKELDNKIIKPIEEYYETYFEFKHNFEIDVKSVEEDENPLVKYGYATRFRFNFIDSYELFENIKKNIFDIDYGLCYLTNDGYIFITIPGINETFKSGTKLRKLII